MDLQGVRELFCDTSSCPESCNRKVLAITRESVCGEGGELWRSRVYGMCVSFSKRKRSEARRAFSTIIPERVTSGVDKPDDEIILKP
jgi:hypothetical protein